MDEQLEKLIQLYATHPVAEIERDPDLTKAVFGRSRAELRADRDFPVNESTVKSEKVIIQEYQSLENPTGGYRPLENPDTKARVGESLHLLWRESMSRELKRKEGDRDVMRRYEVLQQLLWEMFSDNWSAAQKEHFKYYATQIPDWYNCFISYTNRGAKTANDRFRDIIEKILYSSDFVGRNLETENMLPEVLRYGFREENLGPIFFDRTEIRIGQDILDRVEKACKGCFVFLQLVDKATFTEMTPNWPYEEYQIFRKTSNELIASIGLGNHFLTQRLSALVAVKADRDKDKASILPINVPLAYDVWTRELLSVYRYEILPTEPEAFKLLIHDFLVELYTVILGMLKTVPD